MADQHLKGHIVAGNEAMAAYLASIITGLKKLEADLGTVEGKLGKDKDHGKAVKEMTAAFKTSLSAAQGLHKKMKG